MNMCFSCTVLSTHYMIHKILCNDFELILESVVMLCCGGNPIKIYQFQPVTDCAIHFLVPGPQLLGGGGP